eukprot:GHVU01107742.1.p2 GENE.GHVU01107742.1~~GHVU01107742.1.p2  ORF type:complete len:129 (-),score=18.23 GHVU01107742.1:226-612(-)
MSILSHTRIYTQTHIHTHTYMNVCMHACCLHYCAGSSSSSEGEERGGGNDDDACRRRDEPAIESSNPPTEPSGQGGNPPTEPARVCIGGRDADRWLPPPQTHSLTAPHSDSLQDRSNDLTACITYIYI